MVGGAGTKRVLRLVLAQWAQLNPGISGCSVQGVPELMSTHMWEGLGPKYPRANSHPWGVRLDPRVSAGPLVGGAGSWLFWLWGLDFTDLVLACCVLGWILCAVVNKARSLEAQGVLNQPAC